MCLVNPYPVPSMYAIFAYIYHEFVRHSLGKYTLRPMDGMGMTSMMGFKEVLE